MGDRVSLRGRPDHVAEPRCVRLVASAVLLCGLNTASVMAMVPRYRWSGESAYGPDIEFADGSGPRGGTTGTASARRERPRQASRDRSTNRYVSRCAASSLTLVVLVLILATLFVTTILTGDDIEKAAGPQQSEQVADLRVMPG